MDYKGSPQRSDLHHVSGKYNDIQMWWMAITCPDTVPVYPLYQISTAQEAKIEN